MMKTMMVSLQNLVKTLMTVKMLKSSFSHRSWKKRESSFSNNPEPGCSSHNKKNSWPTSG